MKLDENAESWSFIPNQDFNGKTTLNYNVTDEQTISATNTFTLSPINDKPKLTSLQSVLNSGEEDTNYKLNQMSFSMATQMLITI